MKYYSTLGEALGDSIEIPGTVVPSLTVNYPTAPTPQAPATPTDSSGPPSEATKELVGQTYPYPEPVICNQFEFIPEKPNYFLKPGQPGGPAAESEISINNQKCRETQASLASCRKPTDPPKPSPRTFSIDRTKYYKAVAEYQIGMVRYKKCVANTIKQQKIDRYVACQNWAKLMAEKSRSGWSYLNQRVIDPATGLWTNLSEIPTPERKAESEAIAKMQQATQVSEKTIAKSAYTANPFEAMMNYQHIVFAQKMPEKK